MNAEVGETPVLNHVLRQLHDAGHLTVKQMADLLGIQPDNVYPYHHDRQLTMDRFRLIFRHCGNPVAQQALLQVLLEGTDWQAEYCDKDLDVNGDGDVNVDDALVAAIDADVAHAAFCKELVAKGIKAGLTSEQLDKMEQATFAAMRSLRQSLAIARWLREHTVQRRKARPLQPITAGGRA
jgi:hypothetical protein